MIGSPQWRGFLPGLFPLCMLVLTLGGSSLSQGAPPPLWVLIGEDALREASRPLADYRKSEGLEVIGKRPPWAEAIASLPRKPDYIVLLGDDLLQFPASPDSVAGWLPGERRSLYRWRATQPEAYVSDAVIGDLDQDGIPEIPVGRLPGRDSETIGQLVAKLLAFERTPTTREALHLPIWAGNPAYGDHFHANVASNLLRQTLRSHAPDWLDLSLLIGNASDPLSAVPETHGDWFHQMLERGGGLFTGLMGHGGVNAFYSMPDANGWIRYEATQAHQLTGPRPSAPALIFACDCGNFAHPTTSLAESLLAAPSGPVAVIAATTQSHPLPNYYSSLCWLKGLTEGSDRIVDRWVSAQQCGFETRNPLVELFLKEVEGSLGGELDTAQVRRDHVRLYALLGDPAIRLKRPRPLEVTLSRKDEVWTWHIPKPPKGAREVELGHRLPPPPLQPKPKALSAAEALKLFRDTNASLQFQTLETRTPQPNKGWSGQFKHRPGTLRWVVETPSALYVAAKSLPET